MLAKLLAQFALSAKRLHWRSSLSSDFHSACHNRDWRVRPNVHKCVDGTWNFVDPLTTDEKSDKPKIVTGLSCYEAFSKLHELDKIEGSHPALNGSHYSLLSHLEGVNFHPITHKPHHSR